MHADDGHAVLTVRDDGCGLDPETEPGTGVAGMRERALLIRGRLSVADIEPHGTEVRLELPLRPSNGAIT